MANRPIHFEILGTNPALLAQFYRSIFGWDIQVYTGPGKYWLATTGDRYAPGIDGGFMRRYFPQAVINTTIVDSIEETVGLVRKAGGTLLHGPYEIPEVGMHAYCADPEGNIFGVIQERAAVEA